MRLLLRRSRLCREHSYQTETASPDHTDCGIISSLLSIHVNSRDKHPSHPGTYSTLSQNANDRHSPDTFRRMHRPGPDIHPVITLQMIPPVWGVATACDAKAWTMTRLRMDRRGDYLRRHRSKFVMGGWGVRSSILWYIFTNSHNCAPCRS